MILRVLIAILILVSSSCQESDPSINQSFSESTWSGVQINQSGIKDRANVYFTKDLDITIVIFGKDETFTYGPYRTKISSESIQLLTPSLGEEDPVWYIRHNNKKQLLLVYMPHSPFEKQLILQRTS